VKAKAALNNARLLLVTDFRPDLSWRIGAAARGGLDVLQLRDGGGRSREELLLLAIELRELCDREGVVFTVNDDPELARISGAAGVHLGQDDAPIPYARELLGPDAIIGGSAATVEEAMRSVEEGADYVGVGAVYRSRTKPDAEPGGLRLVRSVAQADLGVPWFAIGGITLRTAAEVATAGAPGFAVGGALLDCEDPESVARELRSYLR
jgi:thiamine-phosphate pyrophosphorylase